MALTLDQLITEACEQFAPADAPTRYYTAALPHAQAFRRELISSTSRETITALLQVGPDRTAALPDNYVEYERLGALSDDEQSVYPLSCGDTRAYTTAPISIVYPHDWMRIGHFQIDPKQGVVTCNSLVPTDTILVLEYKSFGAADGEDIAIDPLAHSWGISFILERLHAQKKDWNAVAYHKGEAVKEKDKYKARTRTFSLVGAMQAKHMAAAQRWK